MAATLKFTWLLFLFLSSLWLSIAQTQQEDGNDTTQNITPFVEEEKGIYMDQVGSATTATTSTTNRIEGRKMAIHKVMRVAKAKATPSNSKISACSNHIVEGNVGNKGRKWRQNLNCKQTVGRFSARVDEAAGFVAFNADYRAPRHHPPKNN